MFFAYSNAGKTRTDQKYRGVYTVAQLDILEREYSTVRFLAAERRQRLSAETGLTERQIKMWYQNRRAKERRMGKKQGQQDIGWDSNEADGHRYK